MHKKYTFENIEVEFLTLLFENALFFVITDSNQLGSIISSENDPDNQNDFDFNTLFGYSKNSEKNEVYT